VVFFGLQIYIPRPFGKDIISITLVLAVIAHCQLPTANCIRTFATGMKKGLRTFLSVLLAASVLYASTGVVIASHICLKNKKSDISLFESKSCCKNHDKGCGPVPVNKKNCCQLSISYHKLEVNSVTKISTEVSGFSFSVAYPVSIPGLSFLQQEVRGSDDPPFIRRLLPGSETFCIPSTCC
jgi:hypothetical protein